MMQEITITQPRDTDGAAVIALAGQIEIFSTEDVDTVRELWEESLHSASDPDRYHFLVARAGETIVGFSCYGHRPLTAGAYDFYWLAVDPQQQNRGIGKQLMAATEGAIRSLGGYLVIIETSGQARFAPTRAFYEHYPCELAVRIQDFYAPGDDLFIYTRRL
jgi:GNAT superfamily N-acetyltransferase